MAQLTALACVLALAVGMAAWGAVQLALDPEARLVDVIVEHLAHVLMLGVILYTMIYALHRRWLIAPLRRVNSHLYGVATGHLDLLSYDSPVAEVRELVGGVDLMIRRMQQDQRAEDVGDVPAELAAFRELAARLHSHGESEIAAELLAHCRSLAAALASERALPLIPSQPPA